MKTEIALPAAIAATLLAGFDRHYGLFRYNAQQAKACFENGAWHAIRRLARERITFYDQRVQEAVESLQAQFSAGDLRDAIWTTVKRHYVALLAEHRQPELAETFFNTVSTKILHRRYFHNDFIFVRPAVATEYLDSTPPSYRSYYPAGIGWKDAFRRIIIDVGLACGYQDIDADLDRVIAAGERHLPADFSMAIDCQIHVLRSLFFRNKAAYLIGRLINDGEVEAFAIPLLRDTRGRVFMDTVLFGTERIEALFNFSRAYFMVDMEVPSAYVRFLQTLMPTKPVSELYTMLGLHKQGKTLFYRDLLQHLGHSTDAFVIAPGIKGLVMGVFTLPSFPYVFKFIKDKRKKDVSREYIEGRYLLVKTHDRVGRMADSWEYSDVPFPKSRLSPELLAELVETAPSLIADDGDRIVIRHLYIERRMVPLNLYIEQADEDDRDRAIQEYGQAIKEMVAANIFPGDMLYKNFGVTRQRPGRVLRLRRGALPDGLQLPRSAGAAHAGRRDGVRAVVPGRAHRRVPGGVRHVPARQRQGQGTVPALACGPAAAVLLAGPAGTDPGRGAGRRVPLPGESSLPPRRGRPGRRGRRRRPVGRRRYHRGTPSPRRTGRRDGPPTGVSP